MSDKVDEYINKAVNAKKENKLNEVLDSIIEKLIEDSLMGKEQSPDSGAAAGPIIEALDGYIRDNRATISILRESTDPEAESAVQQFLASLPKMEISERWGDPTSQTRAELKKFTENIGGKTIQEKFQNLMQIQNPTSRINAPARVIASLILLESLRGMIETANAASAGFAFEGFMAALMNGHQVADPEDGSLPIEDVVLFTFEDVTNTANRQGLPVSLKMLKGGKGATTVHGSFTNMVETLWKHPKGMTYVVGYKMSQDSDDFHVRLTENHFTKHNFHRIMTGPNSSDKNKDLFLLDQDRIDELVRRNPGSKFSEIVRERSLTWPKALDGKYVDKITLEMLRCTRGYSAQSFYKKSLKQVQESSSKGDGGAQWTMNATFYLSESNVKFLGEIRLSASAIANTAMIYSDVLRGSIAQVFQSVAELGVHVNGYFVGKNREKAMASGNEAINDTKKITKTLSKDLKQREET